MLQGIGIFTGNPEFRCFIEDISAQVFWGGGPPLDLDVQIPDFLVLNEAHALALSEAQCATISIQRPLFSFGYPNLRFVLKSRSGLPNNCATRPA